MKWITIVLVVFVCLLQYRLWFGKNSVPDYLAMKQEVADRLEQNNNLVQRNSLLKDWS
jgi:cell division protein FtsB